MVKIKRIKGQTMIYKTYT